MNGPTMPTCSARIHDATSEASRPDHHARRADAQCATQMREALTIVQDASFLEECRTLCRLITEAIVAGTYGISREDAGNGRNRLSPLDGADLPNIAVHTGSPGRRRRWRLAMERDADGEAAGDGLPDRTPQDELPRLVLRAIDTATMRTVSTSRHALAVPAMAAAIAGGRVLPTTLPGWTATVCLPTPWSAASIESAAGNARTEPVECGPEADVLPTECLLLVARRPQAADAEWLWILSTQIVHFDARRLPDPMAMLRILAETGGRSDAPMTGSGASARKGNEDPVPEGSGRNRKR